MPETREQIIGRATAYVESEVGISGPISDDAIEASLPIIVKAVTDRVREMHHPVEVEPSTTICADCSWQLPNGRFFGKVIEWPCPTVRLLDQIDAELGGER